MSAIRLPPEIWHLILREATHVPDLLGTTWDYDLEERIWEGWEPQVIDHDLTDTALDTKRSIVQVCREWREIGVEFLYEVIHLSCQGLPPNSAQLGALIEVFKASTVATPSSCDYGWWTKRILCPQLLLSSDHVEQLFTLLERCHNLQIFTLSEEDPDIRVFLNTRRRLMQLLESRFSNCLQRLDINMSVSAPPFADVIPRIVGLTSLTLAAREETPDLSYDSVFRHITTLTIHLPDIIREFPSQWNFPSLRNLSIRSVYKHDVDALIPFIKRHQDTLLHLHVATTQPKNYQLATLLSYAAQIRSLTLDKRDLEVFAKSATVLPDLTHLGITHSQTKHGYSIWAPDSLNLTLDRRCLPNLVVVRLLHDIKPPSQDLVWQDIRERCRRRGVRLEDRRGVPL